MIEFERKNIPLELIYPHYFRKLYYVEKQTPSDSQESDAGDAPNEDSMQSDKCISSINSSQKSESNLVEPEVSNQKISFIVKNKCDTENKSNFSLANEVLTTTSCDATTIKKEFSPVAAPVNPVTITELPQTQNTQPTKTIRPPPGFSCKPAVHGFAPNPYMPNAPIFMPNPPPANKRYVACPTFTQCPNYTAHNYHPNFIPNVGAPYPNQYNYITNVYSYAQCPSWNSQNDLMRMQHAIMQNQNVYGRAGNLNPYAPSFNFPIPAMFAANNTPVQNIPNPSPTSNTVQNVQNMASKENLARDEVEVLSQYLSNLTSTCSVKETESKTTDVEIEKRSNKKEQPLLLLDASLDELERTLGNEELKTSNLSTKESCIAPVIMSNEKDGKFVKISGKFKIMYIIYIYCLSRQPKHQQF